MATQSLNTFSEDIYWGNAQTNPEVAIAATTYYPASTLFFDVSNFRRFVFLLHPGALDTALVAQVRQDTSATVTGSVKDITGATVTIGTTDDNKYFSIEVGTDQLDMANGFRFVTCYVTGAAGSNDYCAINFLAYGARTQPVTQDALYASANRIILVA